MRWADYDGNHYPSPDTQVVVPQGPSVSYKLISNGGNPPEQSGNGLKYGDLIRPYTKPEPPKEGYTLVGWFDSKGNRIDLDTQLITTDFLRDASEGDKISTSFTLTAKWTNVVVKPVSDSLLYTGSPQTLLIVEPGELPEGYTGLQYALGASPYAAPVSGWSPNIPRATKPGTYSVWYKMVGADQKDIVLGPIIVTIENPPVEPPNSITMYWIGPELCPTGRCKLPGTGTHPGKHIYRGAN